MRSSSLVERQTSQREKDLQDDAVATSMTFLSRLISLSSLVMPIWKICPASASISSALVGSPSPMMRYRDLTPLAFISHHPLLRNQKDRKWISIVRNEREDASSDEPNLPSVDRLLKFCSRDSGGGCEVVHILYIHKRTERKSALSSTSEWFEERKANERRCARSFHSSKLDSRRSQPASSPT